MRRRATLAVRAYALKGITLISDIRNFVAMVGTIHSTSRRNRASVSSSTRANAMTRENANTAIKDLIKQIRSRLDHAAAVAEKAEVSIDAGNAAQALAIISDVALPVYEAATFFDAVARHYTASSTPPAPLASAGLRSCGAFRARQRWRIS